MRGAWYSQLTMIKKAVTKKTAPRFMLHIPPSMYIVLTYYTYAIRTTSTSTIDNGISHNPEKYGKIPIQTAPQSYKK
jgi:hypothetical protein